MNHDLATLYAQHTERFAPKRPLIAITGNFGEKGCELAAGYYESVLAAGGTPLVLPPSADLAALEPLLDRIDIQVEITPVPFKDISQAAQGEPSAVIRERVIKARQMQEQRFKDVKGVYSNAQMSERMIHQFAEPDAEGIELLRSAMERLSLSARAYNRILKVARTIADLDQSDVVKQQHLAEAISYRNLDRGDWAERGA